MVKFLPSPQAPPSGKEPARQTAGHLGSIGAASDSTTEWRSNNTGVVL
jgi:hypothetical protein